MVSLQSDHWVLKLSVIHGKTKYNVSVIHEKDFDSIKTKIIWNLFYNKQEKEKTA